MTTNFVWIKEGLSIRQAMSEVVRQAGVHDNIMTVYVVDESNRLKGAIDLKDLITARYLYPFFKRLCMARGIFRIRMRWNIACGCNGCFQSGWNDYSRVFSQNQGGSGGGFRPADYHGK